MIEIEGPDGVIYEFPEGTDDATMAKAMQGVYGAPAAAPEYQNSASGLAGQFGAGSQQGIAQMLGLPVDAIAGGISGVGQLTGLWEPIENPVGGSASIASALEPFRAGIPAPQSDAERFSRRVGEEIGASAVGAPVALAGNAISHGAALGADRLAQLVGSSAKFAAPTATAASSPLATAAVEGASALGSGLGAASAEYLAPDSALASIIGSLAGGIPAGMAASKVAGLEPEAAQVASGSLEGQKARAKSAYDTVTADTSILGPQRATDLELGLIQKAIDSDIDPNLTPGSAALEKVISGRINPAMTIEDVEKLRRLTMGSLPMGASPTDQRVAQALKGEITDYLDNLNTPATEALREGRDATRRTKAAEAVIGATEKAERRAASSGSGGNEINAIRQNLRSMLDNPNKAKSFTASERKAMEEIVRGSTDQNVLRRLSRFAPSSGGLASMLGIGGALASPAIAMPIVGLTEGAKILGERSTKKSVDALVKGLLGERVTKAGDPGINKIIQALLGARIASQEQE